MPTSSAATICSRPRGASASSASCSPPPTTPSASIRASRKIGVGVPVRPDSRYGVSKAFGEALGALYAYKHGLRVTCLRIGNVADMPADQRRLSIWLKPEDLVQLIRIGLEHPDIHYEMFYGASDNARGLVGQQQCLSLRLSAARQGRGVPDARRMAAQATAATRSGRRLVSGRPVLQRRVRRRHRARAGLKEPMPPTAPRYIAPAASCDTHIHIFEPAFPAAPTALAPPPAAPLSAYLAARTALGLSRTVVVQPTAYGGNNHARCRPSRRWAQARAA